LSLGRDGVRAIAPSADERKWAALAHVAALAGIVVPFAGNVLGPLVVWFLKKDSMPFVADQGREALNFQLTIFLASAIGFFLIFLGIGVPLILLLFAVDLVFIWIATFKASEGVAYRYPWSLRLVTK
jgi:uncharacterized Tic20 family protein